MESDPGSTGNGDEPGITLTGDIVRAGSARLAVSGEIDVATGTKLRTALAAGLAEPGVDEVTADLSAVTFMSSTGIAVLVDAHSEARQVGKRLRILTGHNRAVLNPLRVSGVDALLNLDPGD